MTLILAGGFPMLIVLLFGGMGAYSAFRAAQSPSRSRLGHALASAGAVAATSVAGVAMCLFTVAQHLGGVEPQALGPILVAGVGESLAPAVVGFAIVAGQLLLVAAGWRRLPD